MARLASSAAPSVEAPRNGALVSQTSRSSSFARVPFIIAISLLALSVIWLGLERLVTGDEGYYLLAAELVSSGKTPYRDFFYPQMPLLPYVYSLAAFCAAPWGPEWIWISGRAISITLTLSLGYLVWRALRRHVAPSWALLGICALACSANALPVFVTVQTYILSTLLLFSAFMLVDRGMLTSRRAFFAGMCFGLSILTRLPIAGLGPLFILHVLMRSRENAPARRVFVACCGGVFALLPALLLAAPDFPAFWFDNFGYHLVRENLSDHEILSRRLKLLGALVGVRQSGAFDGFQFPILLWISVIGCISTAMRSRTLLSSTSVAALYGVVLIAVHFTPSPPYMQYFSHAVPFLVFSAVLCASQWSAPLRWGALVLAVLYCWPVATNLGTYTGDEMVRGMRRGVAPTDWKPIKFARAAQAINRAVAPAATGISFWAGFFVGTSIRPFGGTENHFARSVAAKMDQARRQRLSILSQRELYAALADAKARYFMETPDAGRGIRQESLDRGSFAPLLIQKPTTLWGTSMTREAPSR